MLCLRFDIFSLPDFFSHIPYKIAHPYLSVAYHNYLENVTNDYGLKSYIFVKIEDLRTSINYCYIFWENIP
ncbi:MAG: hypothetical protein A2Z51_00795 [Deltaproteobacteria bacterium RBG_19FT_COMBO_52_11]|nr:MAG: hypothetical protein A2W27_06230 [Deltaproteobacteria bacterium RBG_16_44_11]OGP99382.1 MAG: hypothetical protein A2Z51_00795 [Deltaproteobacteria bacterium RBG_19FT_COMBO_52_11]